MANDDVDSLASVMKTLQLVGIILGVIAVIAIGSLLYYCLVYKKREVGMMNEEGMIDIRTLHENLLRREHLDMDLEEEEEKQNTWICVVCAYRNQKNRINCLMCGTNVDFLKSMHMKRNFSSSSLFASKNSTIGTGNNTATTIETTDLKKRQRAFFKRRMHSIKEKNAINQRQRGAFRRKLWERKKMNDGKLHWVRQDSTDLLVKNLPSSMFPSILTTQQDKEEEEEEEKEEVDEVPMLYRHPSTDVVALQSVSDLHELHSIGFVTSYDNSLGKLKWKPAKDVTIDMTAFDQIHNLSLSSKKDSIDFEEIMSLDFRLKKQWFYMKLSKLAVPLVEGVTKITVRREHLLEDSMKQINRLTPEELRHYLKIEFPGEPGIDAGGLLREWFGLVCKEIFSMEKKLFVPTKGENMSYWINALSGPESLGLYRLTGILIGKALFEGLVMEDIHLALPLIKHILGIPISFSDLEFLDQDFYKNCQWLRELDPNEMNVQDLCLTFSLLLENGKEIDLKQPNGREIDVTNENKEEYLQLLLEYRMLSSISDQLEEFLLGIYDAIPKSLLSVFDYQELELLLCGIPSIDPKDWQTNTKIHYIEDKVSCYSEQDEMLNWFWQIVSSFSSEEKARLLQFTTGTSRLPVEGFKGLMSSSGVLHPFTIQVIPYPIEEEMTHPHCSSWRHVSFHKKRQETCTSTTTTDSNCRPKISIHLFPKAHTCFNRLDLPLYKSPEELENYLSMVLQMEIVGFGLE